MDNEITKNGRKDWEEFEKQVYKIFDSFDYIVKYNVRFKTKRRYQIDIIAYNEKYVFFIDCKYHKYISKSSEDEFIKNQINRMKEFLKLNDNMSNKKKFILLITKYKTPSLLRFNQENDKLLSIDIQSLNDLLNNIEIYKDDLLSI